VPTAPYTISRPPARMTSPRCSGWGTWRRRLTRTTTTGRRSAAAVLTRERRGASKSSRVARSRAFALISTAVLWIPRALVRPKRVHVSSHHGRALVSLPCRRWSAPLLALRLLRVPGLF